MNSNNQKIYFQLSPSAKTRELLKKTRSRLELKSPNLTFTDPDRWHLTIIHIGQLKPVYQQLPHKTAGQTFEKFQQMMLGWAERTKREVASKKFELKTEGLSLFGGGGVVAVEFSASAELKSVHGAAYQDLVQSWNDYGIDHPQVVMRGLRELKFAHKLSPHVTLARNHNYGDELPSMSRLTCEFLPMKFLYQLHE